MHATYMKDIFNNENAPNLERFSMMMMLYHSFHGDTLQHLKYHPFSLIPYFLRIFLVIIYGFDVSLINQRVTLKVKSIPFSVWTAVS